MTARVMVLCSALILGPSVPVFAEGPVAASARRQAIQAVRQAPDSASKPPARAANSAQGSLATSGMSKGKKILLAIAVGAGIAGAMWAIDQGVEDNTPSSRGLR